MLTEGFEMQAELSKNLDNLLLVYNKSHDFILLNNFTLEKGPVVLSKTSVSSGDKLKNKL